MAWQRYAKWYPKQPKGGMNKTEQAYLQYLELLKRAGEIYWYGKFEGITLSLGHNTNLTVDVPVVANDGVLEMHDVKGRKMKKHANESAYESYYCTEDAKLKLKLAAQLYPFRFKIVWQLKDGSWAHEDIKAPV